MEKEILRMESVTYLEQGVPQLENFNLTIRTGEILGLVPMNYTGLESLFTILQRNLPLHYGYIYYKEKLVNQWYFSDGSRNRISIIRNKSCLAEDLTVTDNVFVLRRGFHKTLIQSGVLRRQLKPFLDEIGVEIPMDACVSELTHFEKIVVELLKAIVDGSNLVVLNNVGAFVSDAEVKHLHKILHHYTEKGISFCYITSHLEEAIQLCDEVSLFNNGRIIKNFNPKEENIDITYFQRMSGFEKKVRKKIEELGKMPADNHVFEASRLSGEYIQNLSFSVAPGECIVLQDLDNRILEELVDILSGQILPRAGEIRIGGTVADVQRNRQIAVIQELPDQRMIFQKMTYLDNLCFTVDYKLKSIWRQNRIKKSVFKEYEQLLGEGIEDKQIKDLSKSQKYDLVYTRILLQNPKVVFCVQPFKEAELALRIHICELLGMMLEKGIAVVILAVNLADSLTLANRLIKIKNGKNTVELDRTEFSNLPDNVPWKTLYGQEPER